MRLQPSHKHVTRSPLPPPPPALPSPHPGLANPALLTALLPVLCCTPPRSSSGPRCRRSLLSTLPRSSLNQPTHPFEAGKRRPSARRAVGGRHAAFPRCQRGPGSNTSVQREVFPQDTVLRWPQMPPRQEAHCRLTPGSPALPPSRHEQQFLRSAARMEKTAIVARPSSSH